MSREERITLAAAMIALRGLTDDELLALYNCVQAGGDPTDASWYGKAASLFTEKYSDGAVRVHSLTKDAIGQEVMRRLQRKTE